MEFLYVMKDGKEPQSCRVEDNCIDVVPIEAVAHIRFYFQTKKNSKTEEWQLVTGATITTADGKEFALNGGTARRLYAKVENTMFKV